MNNNDMKSKKNRKGLAFSTISIVLIIAVIAISVIFNIFFEKFVPYNVDLTSNKEFSISDEAKDYLKKVDKDVKIVGLFDEVSKDTGVIKDYNDQYAKIELEKLMEILNQFSIINDNIDVEYVDPEKNTLYLQRTLGETRARDYEKGDFIVMSGDKVTKVTSADLFHTTMQQDYYGQLVEVPYAPNFDGAFVGSIINVTAEEDHIIGLVTDHNEHPIDMYFKNVKTDLENRAFQFKEMKLATSTQKDLQEYNVLMFLGSQQDLTTVEAMLLSEYLDAGGNAIFLIDSIQNGPSFENLNSVLGKFNLKYNNDVISEGANHYIPDQTGKANILYKKLEFVQGDFLESLNNNYIVLPLSRSLERLSTTADYLTMYPIVSTSEEATSENYSTGEATKGRKLLGAAVESDGSGNVSKILVMGSSGFIIDAFESVDTTNTGLQIMSKTLSWMEGTEDFNVPVKRVEFAKMAVSEFATSMLGIISIALVPLLIVSVGLLVWLRRRHL